MCDSTRFVCCTQKGPTALILATQKGHMKVVKALLDAKADPNTTENVRLSV